MLSLVLLLVPGSSRMWSHYYRLHNHCLSCPHYIFLSLSRFRTLRPYRTGVTFVRCPSEGKPNIWTRILGWTSSDDWQGAWTRAQGVAWTRQSPPWAATDVLLYGARHERHMRKIFGRPQPGRLHPSRDVRQLPLKIMPTLRPAERNARGTRGSGFRPAKVLVRGLHRYRPLLWCHLYVSRLSLWLTEGVQVVECTLHSNTPSEPAAPTPCIWLCAMPAYCHSPSAGIVFQCHVHLQHAAAVCVPLQTSRWPCDEKIRFLSI